MNREGGGLVVRAQEEILPVDGFVFSVPEFKSSTHSKQATGELQLDPNNMQKNLGPSSIFQSFVVSNKRL